jgi:hypothetical protein
MSRFGCLKRPFFCCGQGDACYKPPPAASRPDFDAIEAGVAELVDALDLGSSDESCGGSSPSARTKRFQRLPIEFLESLRLAGSPNKPAQGLGRASTTMKTVLAVRRRARESEKKI